MEATYLKIASFFLEERKLLNFYIDYKTGEDPLGIYPPKEIGALGYDNYHIGLFENASFEEHVAHVSSVFNSIGDSFYLSKNQNRALSAAMYNYFCKQVGIQYEFEEFEKAYIKGAYYQTYEKDISTLTTSVDWSSVREYFEKENYLNFVSFVKEFENTVKSDVGLKNLFSKQEDFLLVELAIRNIGRRHFVSIDNYYYPYREYYSTVKNTLIYIDVEESKIPLNSLPNHNAFYLSKDEPFPWSDQVRMSLITHLDYKDDGLGNYSLKFNLPASQNNVVGSNFSLDFYDADVVKVSLKQVLRYSQNRIQHIASGDDKSGICLQALLEFFTPVFPINYHVSFNSFKSHSPKDHAYFKYGLHTSESELHYRYSFMFQHLKGKGLLSKRFVGYCMYLHDQTDRFSTDVLHEDIWLKLPYWEIPRIQQIVLREYLIKLSDDILNDEPEDDTDWDEHDSRHQINDGLDDLNSADPQWYWNID